MSFDIHIICMRDGEGSSFTRNLFEEIMGRGAIDPKFPLETVSYADGRSEIYGAQDDNLGGAMFNHFGGDTFFNRLWELADRTGSFIWWPDTKRSVAITRPEINSHLPKDIPGSMGRPYLVRSGREPEQAIGHGIDPGDLTVE